MNDKLQNALTELINITLQGKDFLLTEAPDVIQQLILFKTASIGIYVIISITAFIVGIKFLILLKKYDEEDEDSKAAVSMALGFTLTIAGLFLGIEYITTFLKVTLAPKVYLIEYASNLIK